MRKVSTNKKAFFDYQILEDWEAGLVLHGNEIKAIRAGKVNIGGSYIKPFNHDAKTELWWIGSHFNIDGDQSRTKKVLLHGEEIKRILGKLSAGEYTVLPLELYLQRGLAKLKIGLATRKKTHDKRDVIKKRDSDRTIHQELNRRR